MRYCTKCDNKVPQERYDLGFRDCVDCSSVEKKRALDIIVHKTGNSIQHLDAADYKDVEKRFLRGGFRSNLGSIKGGGHKEFSGKLTNSGASVARVGSPEMYKKAGEEAMLYLEYEGLDKAFSFLDKEYKRARLSEGELMKLKKTLKAFSEL